MSHDIASLGGDSIGHGSAIDVAVSSRQTVGEPRSSSAGGTKGYGTIGVGSGQTHDVGISSNHGYTGVGVDRVAKGYV